MTLVEELRARAAELQYESRFANGRWTHDLLRQAADALVDLGNAAVDGLLIGHTFMPHQPTESLPVRDTPLSRAEIEQARATSAAAGENVDVFTARLLATIEQRDRIYAAIQTDADPAGTHRELIELRDLVSQMSRLIEELKAPIPMIIHCPKCHLQHVDVDDEPGEWATRRHHRKHLCKESEGGCGHIFLVANVPTVGVRELPEVTA